MPLFLISWSSGPLLIVTVPSLRSLRSQWEGGIGEDLLPCPSGWGMQLQILGPEGSHWGWE